jgi:hypothetical protein
MTLAAFKRHLAAHRDLQLRFRLPDGEQVPPHAHVTEVTRIEKQILDCGGVLQSETRVQLQLWLAKDFWHRLTAGQLLAILEKAGPLHLSDDLEVDIEHDAGLLSQFPLESIATTADTLVCQLRPRHSACRAQQRKAAKGSFLRRMLGK